MVDVRTPSVLFAALVALALVVSPSYGLSPAGPFPAANAAAEAPPGEWQVECADCPPRFGALSDRALRIDAAGTLHAAYGGDHLYYARQAGAGWQAETVDGGSVGEGSVLALDAAGRPHIAYKDTAQGQLKYAWHDGSAWHVEVVTTGGGGLALALDGDGRPHIIYTSVDGTVAHTWKEAPGWLMETVDSQCGAASVSLAIDGEGQMHLAYQDSVLIDLKYARRDGSVWHVETLDSFWNVGQYCSLAVDAAGHPHISYQSRVDVWPEPESLKYAWHDGNVWHTESIVSGHEVEHTSLELDAAGRPHISYGHPWKVGGLTYAWHDGSAWRVEAVPDPVRVGFGTSLALDAQGQPHLLLLDMPDHRHRHVRHAWHDGTAWQAEYVQLGGSVGDYPSLAIDSAGHAHVAYADVIGPHLKYAWHDGTRWRSEWVDREGALGGAPSLVLGITDDAYVSYVSNGLKVAWREAAGWHIELIDSTASSETGTALALDAAGQPHIAYSGAGGARYAWHDVAGWHTAAVSAAGWPMNVTIALDAAGHPHIAYGAGELFYAWNMGTGWQVESIGPGAPAWSNRWLALDAAGHPHIAYGEGELFYAWNMGTGWQVESIGLGASDWSDRWLALDVAGPPHIAVGTGTYAGRDESGWHKEPVGLVEAWFPSLVLDAFGRPHLSYVSSWSDGNQNFTSVGYARRTGAGWQIDTFEEATGWYNFTSLALDRAGVPHIAYRDSSLYDGCRLMVARRLPGPFVLQKGAMPATAVHSGEPITYTLTLDAPGLDVELWDPLPANVEYISGTLTPPAVYSHTVHAIVWRGTLPTGTVQALQFQVTAAFTGTVALPIVNTAWLTDLTSGSITSSTAIVNGVRFYLPLSLRGDMRSPIVADPEENRKVGSWDRD